MAWLGLHTMQGIAGACPKVTRRTLDDLSCRVALDHHTVRGSDTTMQKSPAMFSGLHGLSLAGSSYSWQGSFPYMSTARAEAMVAIQL